MTGSDLLEALKLTGTGEKKLDAGRKELEHRPTLTAAELINSMLIQNAWPEGTLDKAKKLANGANVREFLGVPPPNVEEGKMRRLADTLVVKLEEVFHERQANVQAEQLGNPQAHKPIGSEPARRK
jgi:hypothetical protein